MEELGEEGGTVGGAVASFDDEGVAVIRLTGEIDISNVDAVRAAIDPAVASSPERVVFDLRALDFMDSSAISVLLQVAAKTKWVQLQEPSDLVRQVIEATGLSELLHMD